MKPQTGRVDFYKKVKYEIVFHQSLSHDDLQPLPEEIEQPIEEDQSIAPSTSKEETFNISNPRSSRVTTSQGQTQVSIPVGYVQGGGGIRGWLLKQYLSSCLPELRRKKEK